MSVEDRLVALIEAEHAAVYGYGVLGARLDDAGRRMARTAYDSHRARRDQLIAALHSQAPAPLAEYAVAVANAAEAVALAVRIEAGLSLRWRDLVGATDDRALRSLGIAGLQETAVRAAQWRKSAGTSPVTVALPGTDPAPTPSPS